MPLVAPIARLRGKVPVVLLAALGLVAAALAFGGFLDGQSAEDRPRVGLFTSLPIYWGETAEMADLLSAEGEPHWVRSELEREYQLQPLDILGEGEGRNSLDGLSYLLLAQPRALSPVENVALDGWVRKGGRLLLFADPMLTEESHFPLGDRRRPQDVVLVSPILTHWGLRLEFDENQPAGRRVETLFGDAVPVDQAGRLSLLADGSTDRPRCTIVGNRLVGECGVGKGQVLIVADAALLDGDATDETKHAPVLMRLAGRAFGID